MASLSRILHAGAAVLVTLAMGLVSVPLQAQTCTECSSPSSSSGSHQNVLGTASGTFTSTNLNCQDSEDDGSNSGALSLSFTDQQGGSFSGVGSGNDRFGSFSLTFTGSTTGSSIYISLLVFGAEGEETSLSASGTLIGGVISVDFSGEDISGDTCFVTNGKATLAFTGDDFVPAVASSAEGTLTNEVLNALRTNANILGSRFRNVRRKKLGLARIDDQGVMLSGEMAGGSAGEGWADMPLGVWASYVRSKTKDDFSSTASKTTRNTVFAGVDFEPWKDTLLGVAAGYEVATIKTRFNGGEQQDKGFTLAPYFGWFISDLVSFDLSGGVTSVRVDQYRTSLTGARVESDTDALRYFAVGNVNFNYQWRSILFTGTGGLLWAHEDLDDYTETNGVRVGDMDASLGQYRLGIEVAYLAGAFEPYVNALYSYDFTRTRLNFAPGVAVPKNDKDDVQLALGLRYFGSNGLSGTLEYSTLTGRSNFDEQLFTANVRWNFE